MMIPIQVPTQGVLTVATPDKMDEITFKDLQVLEADFEEFVRKNVGLLFPDDETLLIVGQQLRNQQGGRSDLVAVDGQGNVVLLELKRDVADIVGHKEAFEMQAIRYVANYALISNPQGLVQKLFAPYVSKHLIEFSGKHPSLTASEIANRELGDFLAANKADRDFNHLQRLVLLASSFDPQTLSACAWLAKSGINIRCVQVSPQKYNGQYFLSVEQLIPPPTLEEFYVEVAAPTQVVNRTAVTSQTARQNLPKVPALFQWGLIKAGDILHIKTRPAEQAIVKDQKQVTYEGKDMSYNAWGQSVTGWSSINIYDWAVHESTKKTLDEMRQEKLQQQSQEAAADDQVIDDVLEPDSSFAN